MRIHKTALNTLIISALVALAALVMTLLGIGMKFVFGAEAIMAYLPLILAVLALVVLSFLFGWIRYDLAGALTLAAAVLHDQLLSLALCAIFSLAFGLSSYAPALLIAGVAATYCFTIPLLRDARQLIRGASSRDMTREQAADLARKKTSTLSVLTLFAAILVLAAFLVSGNIAMVGNVLPLITGLISALLSSRLISPYLWAAYTFRRANRK